MAQAQMGILVDNTNVALASFVTANDEEEQHPESNGKEEPRTVPSACGNENKHSETTSSSRIKEREGPSWSSTYWGGPFYRRLDEADGDFDQYARDNSPFEGIHEIFSRDSRVVRRLVWFLWWAGFGTLFMLGSVPDIRAYRQQQTTTNLETTAAVQGLAFPIVTICPGGTGVRCDCQLWPRLACSSITSSWNDAFLYYLLSCPSSPWSLNDIVNGNTSDVISKICAGTNFTSDWSDDPCGKALLDGETLYRRVQERSTQPSGFFLTMEEMIMYAGTKFNDTNLFVARQRSSLEIPRSIPLEFYNFNYFDLIKGRVCTQVRLPSNEVVQTTEGYENGLIFVMNETFQQISAVSYLGVAMHLNYEVSPDSSEYAYIVPEEMLPIPAGQLSLMGLTLQRSIRKKGYGNEASRLCNDDPAADSRNVCVNKVQRQQALSSNCSNCIPTEFASYYGLENKMDDYQWYGCDVSCFDYREEVQSVNVETCPFTCQSNQSSITLNQQVPQSTWFKSLFGLRSNTTELTTLLLGYVSFEILSVVETPTKTLGALTGEMGGNINLWFGPSMMTVLTLFELMTIGIVVTKCRGTLRRSAST